MKVFNDLAIAALVSSLFISAPLAADVITVRTSTPAEMPIYESPGFDWSGFYAGVFGGTQSSAVSGTQLGLGAQVGVNAQFDFFLLGAEVAVHGVTGGEVGTASYGTILGRAGLVVADDVLIYGAGGYGLDLAAPADDTVLLGGGVEVAVTENVSLEAQYLHGFKFDGGSATDQITLGANFHF